MTGGDAQEQNGERLDACLLLAVQMNALSGLYQGVVHDLKSPLNALVVNLELLRSSLNPEGPQAEKQQRYARIVHEEALRLNRSIESLLPAAAPPAAAPSRFDLRELAGEVAAFIAPQARQQKVTLQDEVTGDGPPLPVTAHRDRIKQALLAVAVNALEAMPDGGTMGVSADAETGRARVTITDTGAGVAKESGDRLYDLYYSTKEGHLGLGLYVAHRVIKSVQGSIQQIARPGGTRFDIVIPLS